MSSTTRLRARGPMKTKKLTGFVLKVRMFPWNVIFVFTSIYFYYVSSYNNSFLCFIFLNKFRLKACVCQSFPRNVFPYFSSKFNLFNRKGISSYDIWYASRRTDVLKILQNGNRISLLNFSMKVKTLFIKKKRGRGSNTITNTNTSSLIAPISCS